MAIAERSVPPRPSVVGMPLSVAPANPATTGTTPRSSNASTSRGSTRRIAASPWRASVTMPAWAPVSATASTPDAANSSANTAAEISSPAASNRSALRAAAAPIDETQERIGRVRRRRPAHGRDHRDRCKTVGDRIANSCKRDGTLLGRRDRRPAELQHRNAARRVHAPTNPFESSNSKICTALVAAPLRS